MRNYSTTIIKETRLLIKLMVVVSIVGLLTHHRGPCSHDRPGPATGCKPSATTSAKIRGGQGKGFENSRRTARPWTI